MQAVAAAMVVAAEALASEAAATVSRVVAAAMAVAAEELASEVAVTVSQAVAPLERTRAVAEADCLQKARIRCSPGIRQQAAGMSSLFSHG